MTTLQIKALIILGILLAAFGAGWSVNGWRLSSNYQAEKLAQQEANQKAFATLLDQRDKMAADLTAATDAAMQKLGESQNETNRLRNRAGSGAVGLRIATTCPTSGLSTQAAGDASVDSGTWAGLAPIAQRAYFNLRAGIDQAAAQLAACQSELTIRQ